MSAITRTAHRAVLKLKKNSPKILFVAGVVGMVGTSVMSARAAVKTQPALDAAKTKLNDIQRYSGDGQMTADATKAETIAVYRETGFDLFKAYAPAVVLGVASVAALTKSHQILTTRNAAIGAAYAGLDKAFKEYRQRVVAELGQQKDTEFAYGVETKDVVVYDEAGNAMVKEQKRIPKDAKSLYGKWFDESNRNWEKPSGYNYTWLDSQQRWCNELLKRRGHLFLNEVYDVLGYERTSVGALVGWLYDSKDPDFDPYVSFGFGNNPDFIAGFERTVFLDFNVGGEIYHMLDANAEGC